MQLMTHTGLVSMSASLQAEACPTGVPKPGKAQARQGGALLALKVQMREIQAALKDNGVFKRVLASLPLV